MLKNILTMKKLWVLLTIAAFVSCTSAEKNIIQTNFDFAASQFNLAFTQIELAIEQESEESIQRRIQRNQGPLVSPRSLDASGNLNLVPSADWTSGFFPGSLWYLYEYTGDENWKKLAHDFTQNIEQEQWNGKTHDMGFKIYCSYGNGYRLTSDNTYRDVILKSAETLITRYNPIVGSLRSWDHNSDKWAFPVIIDNMMNLELLFRAFRLTDDSIYYKIAETHALTTLREHFRNDYSTFHVVDYDTATGKAVQKHTHQGYSHESSWSRGQAWGLYGYTMCYRETGNPQFLKQAERIAEFIFSHPRMPEDLIPYWDFDAPAIPDAPRDASAAAIAASALYELSMYSDNKAYKSTADRILTNLTQSYRAPLGTSHGFLLLHSTGHLPHNYEINVPLVYADYYFLEALLRKQKLENTGSAFGMLNR
jgi:unsaturated chondroitin disaccharide hydrolase